MTRRQPGSSRRSVTASQPTNSTTPVAVAYRRRRAASAGLHGRSARRVCTFRSRSLADDVCAVVVVADGDVVCGDAPVTSGRHEFERSRVLGALSPDGTIRPTVTRRRLGIDAFRAGGTARTRADVPFRWGILTRVTR
jgi:hypothetical protein